MQKRNFISALQLSSRLTQKGQNCSCVSLVQKHWTFLASCISGVFEMIKGKMIFSMLWALRSGSSNLFLQSSRGLTSSSHQIKSIDSKIATFATMNCGYTVDRSQEFCMFCDELQPLLCLQTWDGNLGPLPGKPGNTSAKPETQSQMFLQWKLQLNLNCCQN